MKVNISEFEKIEIEGMRIRKCKYHLFIGVPYNSKMKQNKQKTYNLLKKLEDINLCKMVELFGVIKI